MWARHGLGILFQIACTQPIFLVRIQYLTMRSAPHGDSRFGEIRYKIALLEENQTASSSPAPCTVKSHTSGVLAHFPDPRFWPVYGLPTRTEPSRDGPGPGGSSQDRLFRFILSVAFHPLDHLVFCPKLVGAVRQNELLNADFRGKLITSCV